MLHALITLPDITDHAVFALATVSTLACLIIRRHTLTTRLDSYATYAAAILFVAFAIVSPYAIIVNPRLDNEYSADTWYAQGVFGHSILICGLTLYLYGLVSRFELTGRARRIHMLQVIVGPLALWFPLSGLAWITNQHVGISVLCFVVTMWILGNLIWTLYCIRVDDPRAGGITIAYIVAFGLYFCGLLVRAFLPGQYVDISNMVGWRFLGLCIAVFANAATVSWILKSRYLKAHVWKRIRKEKPLKGNPKRQLDSESAH